MLNQKFGKLTIVKDSERRSKNRQIYWECLCDCGNTHTVRADSLRDGSVTQCKECRYKSNTKHGQRKVSKTSKSYITWQGMMGRCYNKNHADYKNYGARNIIVCKSWHTFENFYKDMGDRPEKMTLDRIDNNGNYELSNCKWSNANEQAQNRNFVKLNAEKVARIKWLLEVNKHTNRQIAEMFNVSPQAITDIKKGRRWSNVEAICDIYVKPVRACDKILLNVSIE